MGKNLPPRRNVRTYPTLREMLRGKNRFGRSVRAPWYAGYPGGRNQSAFLQSLRRK